LTSAWIFGLDEFEVERQSPVRREGSSHREQIGRDVDPARERYEVGGVGQRGVQTLGVALWTQKRLSLAFDVAANTDQTA